MEQQELYLLIVRHLNAATTKEEEALLTVWLQESAENRETYNSIQEIWKSEQELTDNAVITTGLHAVKNKIAARRRKLYRTYAAAAAMLGVIIVSATLFFKNDPYTEVAAAGQITHLTLKDGTLVHLSPASKIRYRQRDIILDGEAFFEVAKNEHAPFTVKAGELTIKVLGTKFNVSDTAVSLVDGKVQVTAHAQTYTLQPGEQLFYNKNEQRCIQREYDVEEVTGWASSILVFRNEIFASAAAKIEKMYDVKIHFTDPETASYRLFARFENKSLEYVLDVIKAADDLDYTIKGKDVYIAKKQ